MRGRDGREGPLHPRTREALGEPARARREGDRAGQPPRLGAAPDLPRVRLGGECPSCDVSLVVHRAGERPALPSLRPREPLPRACPDCGSVTLARAGRRQRADRGRDRRARSRPLPVFRLDSDSSAGRRAATSRSCRRFQEAAAGVLVGTQMVAKGHDFPDVVLGVVLDADATLRFPDFRAEERTFALVAQLAGRSGRGERGGPGAGADAGPGAPRRSRDAAAPRRGRLPRRRARAPPRARLPAVRAPDPGRAHRTPTPGALEAAADRPAAALDAALPAGAVALGPAPRFRLRGRERRQLLVKAPERAPARSP